MAIKIRLARAGTKKRPFYHIVAADSRMPRDGRFLERIGSYNPLLPKDAEERVRMNVERVQHWLDQGAQPTDRIARFLESAGVLPARTRANPKKAEPGEKAQKRAEERDKRAAAAKEAAAAPAAEATTEAPQETTAAEATTEATQETAAAEETTEAAPETAEEPAADQGSDDTKASEDTKAAEDTKASEDTKAE